MNKSHTKTFTEFEEQEIIRLREEKMPIGAIALYMHCGQVRISRFLKERGMSVFQDKTSPRAGRPQDHRPIEISVPEMPNAGCKKEKPEMFFPGVPPQGRAAMTVYKRNIEKAIAICMKCSHQEKCLDYALQAEPIGIWGGTTEMEREYIRVKLGIECARETVLSKKNRKEKFLFRDSNLQWHFEAKYNSPIVKGRLSRRG